MNNSKKLINILLIFLIAFISGCEKTTTIPEIIKVDDLEENISPLVIDHQPLSNLPEVTKILSSVFDESNHNRGQRNNPFFNADDILTEDIVIIENPESGLKTYTLDVIVSHKKKDLFTIVIKEYASGKLGQPMVYRYMVSKKFKNKFMLNEVSMLDFTGRIKTYDLKKLEGIEFSAVVRSDPTPCDDIGPDAPTSGSDGSGGTSGGGYVGDEGTGSGGNGGDDGWTDPPLTTGEGGTPCGYRTEIICGCSPSHAGGRSNPSCNCRKPDIAVLTLDCGGPEDFNQDDCDDTNGTSALPRNWDNIKATYGLDNISLEQYTYLKGSDFTIEEIVEVNTLLPNMEAALSEDGWLWPSTSEEWKELSELILLELQDLDGWANLVIPLSEIESALKNYKNGSYWGAGFDITMAAVQFVPVGKVGKTTKFFAKKLTRSTAILKIFKTVKSLGNTRVYNGFKATIKKEYKNPHIFRKVSEGAIGHVGNKNFDYVLSRSGGQQEMIARVYERAFLDGKLANLTNVFSKNQITLFGKKIDFYAGNIYNPRTGRSEIRIDDFWSPN